MQVCLNRLKSFVIYMFILIIEANIHMKVILELGMKKKYALYSDKNQLIWINIDDVNKYYSDNTKVYMNDEDIIIGGRYLCIDPSLPNSITICNSKMHKFGHFIFLFLNDKSLIKDNDSNLILGIGNYDFNNDVYETKLIKADNGNIYPYLLDVKIYDGNLFEENANPQNLIKSIAI